MAAIEAKMELFETFRTQWQCFRCKVPPGPGTGKDRYLCWQNNHPLCVRCKDFWCPCGSRLSPSKKPCEFIAKTIDMFPWFHCYYYENGCRELLEEAEYHNHSKNCVFREVYCPHLKCEKHPILIDVANHVKNEHKIDIWEAQANEIVDAGYTYGDEYYFHNIFVPHGAKIQDGMGFYFVGYRQSGSKLSFVWIYILGSQDDAKNYECSIYLSKSKEKIAYQGPVHSIDEHFKEIMEREDAFVIREQTLKRFLTSIDKQVKLEFQFSIRCVKNEPKRAIFESRFFDDEPDKGKSLSTDGLSNKLSSLLKVD